MARFPRKNRVFASMCSQSGNKRAIGHKVAVHNTASVVGSTMLARFALVRSLAYRNNQEEMCASIRSYLRG